MVTLPPVDPLVLLPHTFGLYMVPGYPGTPAPLNDSQMHVYIQCSRWYCHYAREYCCLFLERVILL